MYVLLSQLRDHIHILNEVYTQLYKDDAVFREQATLSFHQPLY